MVLKAAKASAAATSSADSLRQSPRSFLRVGVTWCCRCRIILFPSLQLPSRCFCCLRFKDSWEIQFCNELQISDRIGNLLPSALSISFDPNIRLYCCSLEYLARLIVSSPYWFERPNQTDIVRLIGCAVCADGCWGAVKVALNLKHGAILRI